MATFTVRAEGIIRQPALTMPGNATGSEAACTSLSASQIRTLLGLSTTSDVTFDIVRATTSVQTPLVNNASAALTLGNSTHGVTVPGGATITGGGVIYSGGFKIGSWADGVGALWSSTVTPSTTNYAVLGDATNTAVNAPSGSVFLRVGNSTVLQASGGTVAVTGAATFSGSLTPSGGIVYPVGVWLTSSESANRLYFSSNSQTVFGSGSGVNTCHSFRKSNNAIIAEIGTTGIDAYDSGQTKYLRSTHDGTNGIVSTSSGNLNLVPTGGTVAVTGVLNVSNASEPAMSVTSSSGTSFIAVTSGSRTTRVGANASIGSFVGSGTYAAIAFPDGNEVLPVSGMAAADGTVAFGRSSIRWATIYGTALDVSGGVTCAGITASGTITTGGSTTGQVYINQTAGAVVWGLTLQYAAQNYCVFDANGSTGETRIGALWASFYPVLYSAGSPCLSFDTSGNATFQQNVYCSKGLQTAFVTKTANYTTTAADHTVCVTANTIDITLETAVGCAGRVHVIQNSGSGVVTLKTTSSQTISGNASGALTLNQWDSKTVQSDGANWIII